MAEPRGISPGLSMRNVMYTIFAGGEDADELPSWFDSVVAGLKQSKTFQWTIAQAEECPTTNRTHLQGYVCFNKPLKFSTIKNLFAKGGAAGAHLEPRYGTHQEAKDYCSKAETRICGPWEEGEEPIAQDFITASMKEWLDRVKTKGAPDVELIEEDPDTFRKFAQVITRYRAGLPSTLRPGIVCHLFWGEPGTGKSRKAYEAEPSAFRKPEGVWWDGYCGQEAVTIDDFDPAAVSLCTVLRWLDVYPIQVPVKHGFAAARWTTVRITSNLPLEAWYPDASDVHVRALRRRFDNGSIVHWCSPPGSGLPRSAGLDPGVRCPCCGFDRGPNAPGGGGD